jgi:hypothetical protein
MTTRVTETVTTGVTKPTTTLALRSACGQARVVADGATDRGKAGGREVRPQAFLRTALQRRAVDDALEDGHKGFGRTALDQGQRRLSRTQCGC